MILHIHNRDADPLLRALTRRSGRHTPVELAAMQLLADQIKFEQAKAPYTLYLRERNNSNTAVKEKT